MPAVDEGGRALAQADEAMASFDVDAAVAHLSRAIRELTAAGEPCRAAIACVRLGDLLANAMGNLTAARAWFLRARRLVEDQPPCVEQGWVAVAAMGCHVDDPAELQAAAELALDRARRFGDVNLETKALADAGLAHVQAGRIAEGMAMLDEAMALACGPADDGDATAKSVCSFFTACYFAADFGRAASWADLLRRQGLISPVPGGPVYLSSHCDSVHASLLVELGRWGEAEQVLLRAGEAFLSAMGVPSWHADIALADLRIRQGRLAEAEALLVGKDQSMQALLPAAQLHLARGDHALAAAAARRGLRAIGDDRLRAVELLAVLVHAELARGDVAAAEVACAEMGARVAGIGVPALEARAAAARALLLAASGDVAGAIEHLEATVDAIDGRELPWARTTTLLRLAELRERSGDRDGAVVDAKAAAAALAGLDVVLPPSDADLLARLADGRAPTEGGGSDVASLARRDRGWLLTWQGSNVVLPDTKGMRYLAALLAAPGVERHALDLVDAVEGVADGGPDRRALGDAGAALDSKARSAYRHRIEELRASVDDALAAGRVGEAERMQEELDALVAELARAFGLGGRDRRAASAAERARLNVTRALRSAIARITEAVTAAGASLDRSVRTGTYCAHEPGDGDPRWIVQTKVNGMGRD